MELTHIQKDALSEIANMSFGKAATALNSLLNERVEVSVPTIDIETVENASDKIGVADEQVTEILLRMTGDLSGLVLIFLNPDEGVFLEKLLNKGKASAVLPEIGNILVGNALEALSKALRLSVLESIPDVATDMRRSLVISSIFMLGEETDQVLILGTKFSIPKISVLANIYFLFDEKAAKKILGAL